MIITVPLFSMYFSMYFIVASLRVLTTHVTVCVCHTEIKGCLLTYLLTLGRRARPTILRPRKREKCCNFSLFDIFDKTISSFLLIRLIHIVNDSVPTYFQSV